MTKYSYFELEKAATRELRLSKIRIAMCVVVWSIGGLIDGWFLGQFVIWLLKQQQTAFPQQPSIQLDPVIFPRMMSWISCIVQGVFVYYWMSYKEAMLRLKVQTSLCVSEIEDHLRVARKPS